MMKWTDLPGQEGGHVRCGSYRKIVLLSKSGELFRLSNVSQWLNTQGSGKLFDVGSCGESWYLGKDGSVVRQDRFRPEDENAGSKFDNLSARCLSVGNKYNVLIVTLDDQILVWNFETKSFSPLPAQLAVFDISIGNDGDIWAIDQRFDIHHYDRRREVWVRMPGKAQSISCGDKFNVFALNKAGDVLKFMGNTHPDGCWRQAADNAQSIATAWDGCIALVDRTGKVKVAKCPWKSLLPDHSHPVSVGEAGLLEGADSKASPSDGTSQASSSALSKSAAGTNSLPATAATNGTAANKGEPVSIAISVRALPKKDMISESDPIVVLFAGTDIEERKELGRTEKKVNKPNANFDTRLPISQHVGNDRLFVYDDDDDDKLEDDHLIGSTILDWSALHSAPGGRMELALTDKDGKQLEKGTIVVTLVYPEPARPALSLMGAGAAVGKLNWTQMPGYGSAIATGAYGLYVSADRDVQDNNKTYVYKGGHWKKLPDGARAVEVGADGDIWMVNEHSDIYQYQHVSDLWERRPGKAQSIAVGNQQQVAIVSDNRIFKWDPVAKTWGDSLSDGDENDQFVKVDISADGALWGLNKENQVFIFNTDDKGWKVANGIKAVDLAVGSTENVYVVGKDGHVHRYESKDDAWFQISKEPNLVNQINSAYDGTLVGQHKDNNGRFYLHNPGALKPSKLGNVAQKIGCGGSGRMVSQQDKRGSVRLLTNKDTWDDMEGLNDSVWCDIGADGAIYCVDDEGSVFHWSLATASWQRVAEKINAKQVSCADDDNVIVLTSQGVQRYSGGSFYDLGGGDDLISASVGTDGTLWAVDKKKNCVRYNEERKDWDSMPEFAFEQVSIGDRHHVYALDEDGNVHKWYGEEKNHDGITWRRVLNHMKVNRIAAAGDGTILMITDEGNGQLYAHYESTADLSISKMELGDETPISCAFRADKLKSGDAISASDPVVVVFRKDPQTGKSIEVGQTEHIPNEPDPEFKTTVNIIQYSNLDVIYRVAVYDMDDDKRGEIVGEASVQASALQESAVQLPLAKRNGDSLTETDSTITITPHTAPTATAAVTTAAPDSKEVKVTKIVALQISCVDLMDADSWSDSDPKVIVSRRNPATGEWEKVAETEALNNTNDPKFQKIIELTYYPEEKNSQLCRFEAVDMDGDKVKVSLGSAQVNIHQLQAAGSSKLPLRDDAGNHANDEKSFLHLTVQEEETL